MSRADKRRMDRTETWFNSLSQDKKQFIYDVINDKIDSNNSIMTAISDICTVAALDDVLNIDVFKIKEVMTKTKAYIIEYGEYLEREKNGGIEMIENEELRTKVKDKIYKYISGKMDKSKGLKLLKNEFNLPLAELSDIWMECKNGKYPKQTDRVPNNIDESIIEPKDVEKMQLKKDTSLRVINVTTEVQGEYGVYIKNKDGVKIGDKCYKEISDVRNEKDNLASEYKSKMDGIKEKIRSLGMELKEIENLGMKEIEKFTEIESVFSL